MIKSTRYIDLIHCASEGKRTEEILPPLDEDERKLYDELLSIIAEKQRSENAILIEIPYES